MARRVLGVVLVCLLAVGCGSSHPVATRAQTGPDLIAISLGPSPTSPPATTSGGSAPQSPSSVLQLISASTGQVVAPKLAADASSVSLSPDGSAVYYEGNGHDPFPIERVSTHGGPSEQVGSGEDPTVSPDSAHLAYATGSGHAVAIEDLAHHTTRTIELSGLIGNGATFLNTPGWIAWLSDNEFVAVPPPDGDAFPASAASTTTAPAAAGTCTAVYQQDKQCAILIDLTATSPAHLAVLSLPRFTAITAVGAGPDPNSLLVGTEGGVFRLTLSGTTAVSRGELTLPDHALVEGFSPDGRHVLYLRNSGPVQLWEATINPTSVSPGKELLPNVDLEGVSW